MMEKEKNTNGIRLLIRCVVRDPDGKILTDTGQKPANSFVIQFLEFIYFNGIQGNRNATSTDAGEQYLYYGTDPCLNQFYLVSAVGNSGFGLVIGTGDTAATNADIVLETQLTEGTGAGRISHGEGAVGVTGVVGGNVDLSVWRSYTNQTGSVIGVKEAGAYVRNGARNFCIIRDVLGATVNVPDKCSLMVYYTLRTTV